MDDKVGRYVNIAKGNSKCIFGMRKNMVNKNIMTLSNVSLLFYTNTTLLQQPVIICMTS